jgi:hypothetical protein
MPVEQIKTFIPTPVLKKTHPFEIVVRSESRGGKKIRVAAVAFHSGLFSYMNERGEEYFEYKRIEIEKFSENGLDFAKEIPASLDCTGSSQNFYCVLNITVNNLRAQSAKIQWISSDRSQNDLDPIKLDGEKRQTEARVIIGVVACDTELVPGLPQQDSVKFPYIIQFVNTNLIMCNMVFNGVPVIYPAPISGGRLNF